MNIQNTSRKTFKPLLVLSLLVVFAISTTVAYFTSSSQSDENIFTSGDLEVQLIQDQALSVQDWSPGDERSLVFSMVNSGLLSEYVKGYIGGSWSNEQLDSSVFKITKLERKVGEAWVIVNNVGLGVGEEFYLSMNGSELNPIELLPGQIEEFRASIKLDEMTGDEYQAQTFIASLHVAAKQTISGAEWPSTY